jgi:hypothetical protein
MGQKKDKKEKKKEEGNKKGERIIFPDDWGLGRISYESVTRVSFSTLFY